MAKSPDAAARLRQHFQEAMSGGRIGGATVLRELGDDAYACIAGSCSDAQSAVAYALGAILKSHADDRDERPVTTGETYQLMAEGADHLSDAVKFVETGGSAEEATRIIAALARLAML